MAEPAREKSHPLGVLLLSILSFLLLIATPFLVAYVRMSAIYHGGNGMQIDAMFLLFIVLPWGILMALWWRVI